MRKLLRILNMPIEISVSFALFIVVTLLVTFGTAVYTNHSCKVNAVPYSNPTTVITTRTVRTTT